MKMAMERMRRLSLAALTVAALGFGGAQALAAPAPEADARKVCNPRLCNRICQAIGSIGGFCTSNGSCVCYVGR